MLVKSSPQIEFETAPVGNHVARCFSIVDLGLVEQGGQFPGFKHKIRWAFELCNETMEDGRLFSVSENLTASLSEKARLYERLINWRGKPFTPDELKGFDLKKVLGIACMVNVVHNTSADGTRVFANIKGISPLPKGMDAPELQNPILHWEYGMPDENLPEWLKDKIGKNPNGPQSPAPVEVEDFDDDIPF